MRLLAVVLLAATLALPAQAQTTGPSQPGGGRQSGAEGSPGHRGPPPQALQACQDRKAGQPCSFTGRRGVLQGSCWAPQGKPLACRPADEPRPGAGDKSRPPAR